MNDAASERGRQGMAQPSGERRAGERRVSAAERKADALALRKAGRTFDDIAAELGYAGRSGAYKAVMVALQQTVQEPADELRTLECERLDAMLAAIWPKAMAGDTWSIDRVISIMDRRARLLGLDAPLKREDKVTIEVRSAAERIAARTGATVDEVIAHAERMMRESVV